MSSRRSFCFFFSFLVFSFFGCSFPGIAKEVAPPLAENPDFSANVKIASNTANFELSLATPGCVTIVAHVKGKKSLERLWGPQWLEPGKFRIPLPVGRITGKTGTAEKFSIALTPKFSLGRSGKGERQFIHPTGIGWDPAAKELYVADTGNDRIVRFTADGNFLAQYGGFGISFGEKDEEREESLDEPWDVAPGGFSNLYVSDQNNDRICEFDAYKSFKGNFFPKTEDTRNRLNRPKGIMIDTENNVWVVDGQADRVLKLAANGFKLLELGGFGWSTWQFKDPTQVAVDNEGRIFICDRGNHRIQVFDRLGSHIQIIKDHLKSPVGVAVDPDGLIYICDEKTSEVGVYLPDGKRISFYSGYAPNDQFRAPSDLLVTPDRVYVADTGNHRIAVFERNREAEICSWQGPGPVIK